MTRTLLADLLDVSRIAEGKLDLKLEPIDLRAFDSAFDTVPKRLVGND